MALLAQHGWGKSDKIERGIETGSIGGVILSPRDESPASLEAYVSLLQDIYDDLTIFVDPQYYATTVTNPRSGKLSEYSFFQPEKTYRDFVRPSAIRSIVSNVMDYQISLPVSNVCAPVVAFDSFGDRWNSIALSMAAESIAYYAELGDMRPLLVSFVINENAFRNFPEVEEFLDIVTDFECDGFYIVIRRIDSTYRQDMESALLSSVMYMTHVLAMLNEFTVYFGYSDFIGLPLHAVGATASGCGWSQGLRQFTFSRFEQSTGGKHPRERYSSLPLLNSIYINPELDNIRRSEMLNDVLTETTHDGVLNISPPSRALWPANISALHHWESLDAGIKQVTLDDNISDRLNRLSDMVTKSRDCYEKLSHAGVHLVGTSGPAHLNQWELSIAEFRDKASV